jgi:uncharacterized membrane protein
MEAATLPLLASALFALVIVPIIAISAFIQVRRLNARQRPESPADPQMDRQLANITARLYAVETKLSYMASRVAASSQPAPAAPEPASEPESRPILPAAAPPIARVPAVHLAPVLRAPISASPRANLDYESMIAGSWLNYAGILAVLFAVAFFLKYAFDNNWVGPRGRVGIGLIFGAALLVGSDNLLRRGYRYFSEGIAGLGAAALYLSLWGGWHYYRLFDQTTAFAAMIVVTAAMIVVAIGRNSERIAVMALAGGFLTPQLLSTGKNAEITLFTYCLVLVVGLLALERVRDWAWLPPLAFVWTQIYYWGWFSEFYRADELGITLLFATIFFIAFSALPAIRTRAEGKLSDVEIALVPANALVYLGALYKILWPDHRWAITFAVLALAAAHLAVLRALPEPRKDEPPTLSLLFSGIALTYATLAIPLRLDHEWLTIALAIEGALLIWSGFRARLRYLRAAGFILFAVTAVRLLMLDATTTTFIFNSRLGAYAAVVACFASACFFARDAGDNLLDAEKVPFAALAVAANSYALLALSLEVWDALGRTQGLLRDHVLAQTLGLSILWTLYATALIIVGLARKSALLRWQALALFGLVVTKVFFFDLSFLERFYRILSFLVLGLLLLLVSFLYQRKLGVRTEGTKS